MPDPGKVVRPLAARRRVLELVNDATDRVQQLLACSSDRIVAFEIRLSTLLHDLTADRSRARRGLRRLACRCVRLSSGLRTWKPTVSVSVHCGDDTRLDVTAYLVPIEHAQDALDRDIRCPCDL